MVAGPDPACVLLLAIAAWTNTVPLEADLAARSTPP